MLSSSSDHTPYLRDSLTLIEQVIRDLQTQRKKLLRLSKTSKSGAEVNFLASILEAIENSLQKFSSSDYVLKLRDSLVLIFQAERNKLFRLSRASRSSTEVDISASVLEAVEKGLQQLSMSHKELMKQLEEELERGDEEAIREAEEELLENLRDLEDEREL